MRSGYLQHRRGADSGLLYCMLIVACMFCIAGCTKSADIVSTTPANGASGVPQETDVQVVFSSSMDPETIANTANFMVLGSSGGTYNVEATYDDETRTVTLAIVNDPTAVTAPMFALGETVTVTLTSRVTSSIGIPLDRETFSFTIAGVASGDPDAVGTDQFLVSSTDPASNEIGVAAIPAIEVEFDQRVALAGVGQAVRLRGEQTGFRSVGVTAVDQGDTDTASQFVVNMTQNMPFAPGERVAFPLPIASLPTPGRWGREWPRELAAVCRYLSCK